MKKIILLLALFAFYASAYSQTRKPIFIVPDSTTAFGVTMPSGHLIYDSGSNKIWTLIAPAIALNTIQTSLKTIIVGGSPGTFVDFKNGIYTGSGTVPSSTISTLTDNLTFTNLLSIESLNISSNGSVYNKGTGGILDNTAFGLDALITNLTGSRTTAIGRNALKFNTASENSAFGWNSLSSNTTGSQNVAIGRSALELNQIGFGNTAIGYVAGSKITGNNNTVVGASALSVASSAIENTAIGVTALRNTSTGASNTSVGYASLLTNTVGTGNTAVGKWSLVTNLSGGNNTSVGLSSLHSLSSGSENVSIGYRSNFTNITGSLNISLGFKSGQFNTESNALYIHNGLGVSNSATEKTNSLIYGVMDAIADNQKLIFNANVGIGVIPNASAILDVTSTIKGFLPPRMTAAEMNTIISPVAGLLVFETDANKLSEYDGTEWHHLRRSANGVAYVSTPVETAITTIDTPVKALGITTTKLLDKFDNDGGVSNRLRYTGTDIRTFMVNTSVSMTSAANNKVYSIYLYVFDDSMGTGMIMTPSRMQKKITTGADIGAMPMNCLVELDNNDYVEVWIENNTDATNATLKFMNLAIK